MTAETGRKFVVWRRNDGYIDVSLDLPRNHVTGGAEPLTPNGPRPGGGQEVSYVSLGEFTEWWPCHDFVRTARLEETKVFPRTYYAARWAVAYFDWK
jgi:hypothetical protein